MFLNPFPNAIGLDISDLSIKVVQLRNLSLRRRRPAFELAAARITALPHGLTIDGELQHPEKLRKYIDHLLRPNTKTRRPIGTRWVVASVPDNQSFLKLVRLDKSPDDIIEEDILSVAKKHVPIIEDDYHLDWQIMPNHSGASANTEVLLGAIPKQIAEMYTYLLESVGLSVIALELRALATARSVAPRAMGGDEGAHAILDIGATATTLTIYDHNHIQFSSSFPYSGELLTTAIAQKLHLSYDEAEMSKKTKGLEYHQSPVWSTLSHFTDQLVAQIQKTLLFYISHFPDAHKVGGIILCGGGATLKRLDKILSLKLKIPCRLGDVWQNLSARRPIPLPQEQSLAFATAVGLALRAADNPLFHGDMV